jgi:glycosyltransferase involved in cell wall biosynthesis
LARRPLRVLHLGNIANNAYNNAKIQRQRGIEADVVSWDYFHVMGSPEWEDAEFDGDVGDPFFPDWWAVDLHGFERPRWFAQGRVSTCERYLVALRRRDRTRAAASWRLLELDRWLRCRNSPVASALRTLLRPLPGFTRHWRLRLAHAARLVRAKPDVEEEEPQLGEQDLPRRWREAFPDREPLTEHDSESYVAAVRRWRRLFSEYDIVQAYGPAAIVPLVCGARFVAYEHGTLRELPFEDSAVGRLCALAYREADAVLVTNSDVLPSARRLGIADERLVFLPHAIDSERLLRFAESHPHLAPSEGDEVVFAAPTRQDWVDGDPSWAKGNDRAIRALALVRDEGLRCRLLLGGWGRHLEDSRRLLAELELTELVTWIPALRKTALWELYLSSHAVVDQFVVPAIGGVAFEAMGLGRRVITALDGDTARVFFGAEPAVFAAAEPREIADAMKRVIADPLDQARLGANAREWFARYHSADRIVALQTKAYGNLLGVTAGEPTLSGSAPVLGARSSR